MGSHPGRANGSIHRVLFSFPRSQGRHRRSPGSAPGPSIPTAAATHDPDDGQAARAVVARSGGVRCGVRGHRTSRGGRASSWAAPIDIDVVARDHGRGHLAARLGVETIPGEQSVGALAPRRGSAIRARVRACLAINRSAAARSGATGGASASSVAVSWSRRSSSTRSMTRAIDPLEPKLVPYRPLAARSRAVARLDPGSRERLVVEHAELGHPGDGAVDEVGPIAGRRQPATNLRDRPGTRLEEPRGRLEDDRGIIDRSAPLAPFSEAFAPASHGIWSPSGGPSARRS